MGAGVGIHHLEAVNHTPQILKGLYFTHFASIMCGFGPCRPDSHTIQAKSPAPIFYTAIAVLQPTCMNRNPGGIRSFLTWCRFLSDYGAKSYVLKLKSLAEQQSNKLTDIFD